MNVNQNRLPLSEKNTSAQSKIAFAREAYDGSLTAHNTYKQTFHPIIFAGLFGFRTDAALLDFDETAIVDQTHGDLIAAARDPNSAMKIPIC